MTQFRALLFVRAGQPLAVSDISTALERRLDAASALINRLDRLGLVSRAVNPRDRGQILDDRMTERGREAWLIALHEAVQAFTGSDTSI